MTGLERVAMINCKYATIHFDNQLYYCFGYFPISDITNIELRFTEHSLIQIRQACRFVFTS